MRDKAAKGGLVLAGPKKMPLLPPRGMAAVLLQPMLEAQTKWQPSGRRSEVPVMAVAPLLLPTVLLRSRSAALTTPLIWRTPFGSCAVSPLLRSPTRIRATLYLTIAAAASTAVSRRSSPLLCC